MESAKSFKLAVQTSSVHQGPLPGFVQVEAMLAISPSSTAARAFD